MHDGSYALIGSIAIVLASYIGAAAVRAKYKHAPLKLGPLQLSEGLFGNASLANFQVLFFTFIVYWATLYLALRRGTLAEIDASVLLLLGISVTGSAGAKLVDLQRCRLSLDNWAWLKAKGWVDTDYLTKGNRQASWTNVLMSEQGFEVERFQALVFSLVVGLVIVVSTVKGELAGKKVPDFYLYLMGISQGVYVVNKLVAPATIRELNAKLNELRKLETSFIVAVCNAPAWTAAGAAQRDHALAKQLAPTEYNAFAKAAQEAAVMVHDFTKRDISAEQLEPSLPA